MSRPRTWATGYIGNTTCPSAARWPRSAGVGHRGLLTHPGAERRVRLENVPVKVPVSRHCTTGCSSSRTSRNVSRAESGIGATGAAKKHSRLLADGIRTGARPRTGATLCRRDGTGGPVRGADRRAGLSRGPGDGYQADGNLPGAEATRVSVGSWPGPCRCCSGSYGQVARLLDVGPEDEVLDVACGSGVFLRRYAPHAKRIAGVDHSEIQIGVARRLNRSRVAEGTAEFVQGDSAALPWGDGRFSAVTCNCLGCFDEPQWSLEEMCRVLRQGGRAVISTDYYPDEARRGRMRGRPGCPLGPQRSWPP